MSQPRPNETKETADLFIALIKSIELLKNVYIWPQEFIVFEKKKIRDLCFTVPAGGGLIFLHVVYGFIYWPKALVWMCRGDFKTHTLSQEDITVHMEK